MRYGTIACAAMLCLASCAATPGDHGESQRRSVIEQAAAEAKKICNDKYIKRGQLATWARCANDAERPLIAFQPYPDLLELKFASRVSLMTKVDKGEITPDEAQLESAKLNAQVMAEFERRTNARQSVAIQAIAASAAVSASEPTIQLIPMSVPRF